jgi:hypothetical protein
MKRTAPLLQTGIESLLSSQKTTTPLTFMHVGCCDVGEGGGLVEDAVWRIFSLVC